MFAVNLQTGASLELGSVSELSNRLVLSKDKLYWSESSTDATSANGSVLMAMSTAGEIRGPAMNHAAVRSQGMAVTTCATMTKRFRRTIRPVK